MLAILTMCTGQPFPSGFRPHTSPPEPLSLNWPIYSLQVFRLVVDRDGVRPGMFPSLEHIEVVLWKPVVSEVDLLPLLQALPEVRSERSDVNMA